MEFADSWLWIVFLSVGLVMIIMELLVGVDTGLDLVILGSVFVIGGLATWPSTSWIVTAAVISALSVVYLFLGRKYVHHQLQFKDDKTNIDTIIGMSGLVRRPITESTPGSVMVGYEEWRARSDEEIGEGEEIIVTDVSGVTLTVEKKNGGNN